MKSRRLPPAFSYRAGIRIPGTSITCDAAGFPSDLVFLSHANALAPRVQSLLTSGRSGRRQLLTTETTLRLLGEAGEKLRERALPAAFGRPFNLGANRFEVLPSGYLPGAASLLCETDARRVLYLGSFCLEPLVEGCEPALLRRTDAVCVDATFADPERVVPPRRQTLAQVRAFVEQSLRDGNRLVLFASPFDALPAVVLDLARAGIAMRAERRVSAVLTRLRRVCDSLPVIPSFGGKANEGEVLLWPPQARNAASLAALGELSFVLVSGAAADPAVLASMGVKHGFALTNLPSFAEIVSAIDAMQAGEVAVFGGAFESVATSLRGRGFDAYALGPPRQMSLPAKR
jgi:hypothetical protein